MISYNKIIETIETKHGIDVRDYAGLFSSKDHKEGHFNLYERVTGDFMPLGDNCYPDVSGSNEGGYTVIHGGIRREATKKEYDEDFKKIHDQYERYQLWNADNPQPPYLDYWHWLLENSIPDVSNGCKRFWGVKEIVEDKSSPAWVVQITNFIIDEFKSDIAEDGTLEIYIDW